MTETEGLSPSGRGREMTKRLRDIFEQAAVYADRFPPQVRDALDVPDPLTDVVVEALRAGKHVVISGNAGDGKSHLAQRALDSLRPREYVEVTAGRGLAQERVGTGGVVFLRDVSALTDDQAIAGVELAVRSGCALLATINEGPLDSLAEHPKGELFRKVRDVLHDRTEGGDAPDPEGTTLVNLAGRQFVRSGFVNGALDKLLPVVAPCQTCGRDKNCPRYHGARMLQRSKRARLRLTELVQLLGAKGHHLSTREIWVFLIELFFGWICPAGGLETDGADGYFWSRVFGGDTKVARLVSAEFDPINAPMPKEDAAIWRGDFGALNLEVETPGGAPSALARQSRERGLQAFASAKRAYFFFGIDVDAKNLFSRQSTAPQFGALLETVDKEPRKVIRELVTLINRYRVASRSANELWVSRHHSMAAHKRPAALAAAYKLPIEELRVRAPFRADSERYPGAGFFPDRLLLHWTSSAQMFVVEFETWARLREPRLLTVDRDQESLDFALDLFMAQAPAPAIDDPEIHFFDHARNEAITIRIRPDERSIEVL